MTTAACCANSPTKTTSSSRNAPERSDSSEMAPMTPCVDISGTVNCAAVEGRMAMYTGSTATDGASRGRAVCTTSPTIPCVAGISKSAGNPRVAWALTTRRCASSTKMPPASNGTTWCRLSKRICSVGWSSTEMATCASVSKRRESRLSAGTQGDLDTTVPDRGRQAMMLMRTRLRRYSDFKTWVVSLLGR